MKKLLLSAVSLLLINTSTFADNQFFTIDSGEGTSQNLGALGLPLGSLDKIFVTHWHSDHMAGIGYLNNVSWLSGRTSNYVRPLWHEENC